MKSRLFSLTIFQWLSLLAVLVLFYSLRLECIQADKTNMICLSSLDPALTFIRRYVMDVYSPQFRWQYYRIAFYSTIALFSLIFIAFIIKDRRSWWSWLYVGALAICAYGEFMNVRLQYNRFALYYIGGLVLTCGVFYTLAKKREPALGGALVNNTASYVAPRWFEITAFGVLMVAIAATRFYAVNQIPGHWDAEMCGHRPVVASWKLMVEQELGRESQTAVGLSWMLVHRFLTRFDDPFFFFLDQRLLGALISLTNCWLVYFMLRYLAGPFAAMMGLIVFGFGPLEIEWARGATMHHLPLLLGLLLLWWSCKAFQEKTWRAFLLVAVLIIASKYFYPSVRLIALGPVLASLGVLVWHRDEWIGHKRKLLLVVVGCLGYLFSRTLLSWYTSGSFEFIFPFEKIQPVKGAGDLLSALVPIGQSFLILIREIFSFTELFGHYTFHATIHPARALPSLVMIFAGIALVRLLFLLRHPTGLIWFGVMLGGIVPALLTGLATRRYAFTVTLIGLLAVVELAWFVNKMLAPKFPRVVSLLKASMITLVAVSLCCFQASAMFSRKPSRPYQLNFIEAIRPHITPGTFVIHMTPHNPCPFFYGIYDILKRSNGEIGYAYSLSFRGGAREAILNPRILSGSWQYRNTALASQVPYVRSKRDWQRLLYVPVTEPLQKLLKERYPHGRVIEIPSSGNKSSGILTYYGFEVPFIEEHEAPLAGG